MYLWEHSLEEIKQLTTSQIMIGYYSELCKEAKSTINNCSYNQIRDQMAKLNVINIKLVLYFFYLSISDEEKLTSEEIIGYIQKDYNYYFYESVSIYSNWQSFLLNSNINPIQSRQLIWDVDFKKEVIKQFEDKKNHIDVNWDNYKNVILYFEQWKKEASCLIKQLNSVTFSELYPYILGLESRCQLLIEELVYQIESETLESEQNLLYTIEEEYINNVQGNLKFIYTEFDKESIRYVVY